MDGLEELCAAIATENWQDRQMEGRANVISASNDTGLEKDYKQTEMSNIGKSKTFLGYEREERLRQIGRKT